MLSVYKHVSTEPRRAKLYVRRTIKSLPGKFQLELEAGSSLRCIVWSAEKCSGELVDEHIEDRVEVHSLSCSVMVPSKSVKKMNFGLVFMAGSCAIVESPADPIVPVCCLQVQRV